MTQRPTEHDPLHLAGAVFPMAAALAFYGWRSLIVMFLVVGPAALGVRVWRGIGRRGALLRYSPTLWMALLLSLMLPAQLAMPSPAAATLSLPPAAWAILPAAGLLLVIVSWLIGGGRLKLEALLLAYLLVALAYPEAMTPRVVLRRTRMVAGDIANIPPAPASPGSSEEPWFAQAEPSRYDATWVQKPAATRLSLYTRGQPAHRGRLGLEAMLRDDMPPLEDLVIGGHPSALGTGSAIAVLIGGLVLIYCRVTPGGVPPLTVLAAYAAFLLLPVPAVVSDSGVEWRSLILRTARLDWRAVFTFADYEWMVSPLLFMAFFLAGNKLICPQARPARRRYALLLGVAAAAAQLYLSAAHGPYLALAAVALLGPWLDKRWAGKEDKARMQNT